MATVLDSTDGVGEQDGTRAEEAPTTDEIVAEIAWHASFHDRECIRLKSAMFDRLGLNDRPGAPRTLSHDDLLDLEEDLGTTYVRAISGLAVAVGPAIRRRVEALGDMRPLLGNGCEILDLPDGGQALLAKIFEEAGIAERFDWPSWSSPEPSDDEPRKEATQGDVKGTPYVVSCNEDWTETHDFYDEAEARAFMEQHALAKGRTHSQFRLWRLAEHYKVTAVGDWTLNTA